MASGREGRGGTASIDPRDRPDMSPGAARASAGGSATAREGFLAHELDLAHYWRVLVKRRWVLLSILGLVLLASIALTLLSTPIFRATSVLEIQEETQRVVQVGGVASQPTYDPLFQFTQYELLQSRALAERVAGVLEVERLLQDGEAGASGPGNAPRATKGAPSDEAVAFIRQGTSIEPVRNSRLVRVQFDSPDPVFSARAANALAEEFIASGVARRFGASSYAREFLEGQLADVKSRLEESERELVEYAQREGLVANPEGQSLANRNLGDLNAALAAAQEQRIRAQARWSQSRGVNGMALPGDMLAASIIRALQEQRAGLQGEYQQKLQVFKPDYPEMQQLAGRIEELDRQIGRELANIRASVRAEYDAAVAQERLLHEQLETLRATALDVDSRSIEYNILKREVDTNRELYDGLLQRYKEVGVAGDVRSDNILIIDRAQVPHRPFKPNLGVNLSIGLLLGLLLGGAAAFLIEYLDDTLKLPSDMEATLGLPLLGAIPKLEKQDPAQAARDPRSAFSESYRSARTALQFSTNQGAPASLLITSAVPGEGKSTSALMLARNFAQMGQRVLLVDGDLRNPTLHRMIGVRSDVGLSNFLAGGAGLAEVTVETDELLLHAVLSGPLPPNPAELLGGPRLEQLLEEARLLYDQVIIDGPPVMGLADAPLLSHAAAATLMVVLASKTRIGTAQMAVKRLQGARARLIGGLVTQFNAKAAGYGYGYEGYYSYGASRDGPA